MIKKNKRKWVLIYTGENEAGVIRDFEIFNSKKEVKKIQQKYTTYGWCDSAVITREVK